VWNSQGHETSKVSASTNAETRRRELAALGAWVDYPGTFDPPAQSGGAERTLDEVLKDCASATQDCQEQQPAVSEESRASSYALARFLKEDPVPVGLLMLRERAGGEKREDHGRNKRSANSA
jgi:hypothetical protein